MLIVKCLNQKYSPDYHGLINDKSCLLSNLRKVYILVTKHNKLYTIIQLYIHTIYIINTNSQSKINIINNN